MLRRVVVTGMGAVTPLGVGVERTWQRLVAGESGISNLAQTQPGPQWAQLPSTLAGTVPEGLGEGRSEGTWRPADWMTATDERRMSRFAQFAAAAADMALVQGGWTGPQAAAAGGAEETGVCIGSGIGNLADIFTTSAAYAAAEESGGSGYRQVSPLFVPRILINMAAGQVAMRHGFQGPSHAAATACTTGAHALGDAARFIALGDADVMVAGGAESCVHPLTLAGFGRARSLASTACRPFDHARSGFVVAEGAAVLLLEELGHAQARGAPILAELRGYGCSGDAYHMTAPRPDGKGALRAMRRALQVAGLRPRDVDYVNAHATGTRIGDAAEAAAIQTLMAEDHVLDETTVTVSSTKGAVGHLLGAAGAVEALFCVMAINNNTVPPTLNLDAPDVGPAFNFVPKQAQEKSVSVALTNSFGFGGTNASLVFSSFP